MELKLDNVTFKKHESLVIIQGKKLEDNHMILKEEIPALIEFLKFQIR